MKKIRYIIYFIFSGIVFMVGCLLIWMSRTFEVNLSVIINTLLTPLEGSNNDTAIAAIMACAIGLGMTVVCTTLLVWLEKHYATHKKLISGLYLCGIIGVFLTEIVFVQYKYNVIGYMKRNGADTNLYAERYVDPRDVTITSPAQKRNLIYIYLESMETIYADKASGGKQKSNLIKNLTQYAQDNISFSATDQLGGFVTCEGAGWTMGALFTTSSGVPFELPVGDNSMNLYETFASGIYTMGDFLKDQGYQQMFLCGSEGMFAGRKTFYEQHGSYDVYDYNRAISEGDIPPDYYVWWGLEDARLYEIAKRQLLRLAENDEPFNFTMLTVDTHFKSGYICDLCDDTYKTEAANVVACADEQVTSFIEWIKQQDFYENTTIVISGDHPRMDKLLVKKTPYNERYIYNCFINSVYDKGAVNQKRQSSSLDVFPTVLSAMGYEIEGNRLGLGANLFSREKTLVEEMGIDDLNMELMKTSKFYMEHFAPELLYLIEDEFSSIGTIYFYGEQDNVEKYVTGEYQYVNDVYWIGDKLEVDIPLEQGSGDVQITFHISDTYNGEQRLQMIENNQVVEEVTTQGNSVVTLKGQIIDGHCKFTVNLPDAISPHEVDSKRKSEIKRSLSLNSITFTEKE